MRAYPDVFSYDYHNKIVSDLDNTIILLSHTLNGARIQSLKVTEEAVKCFQVSYVLCDYFGSYIKSIRIVMGYVCVPSMD